MNTQEAIAISRKYLSELKDQTFDLISITRPVSPEEVHSLAKLYKIVSKISPLVGNLIEFKIVSFLNGKDQFRRFGKWIRQDPGFPDAIFRGSINPPPGLEVKAWYPLSTEITGRFKESQKSFSLDQTHVVILAWIPEYLLCGQIKIIDLCVVSSLSISKKRDDHYYKVPNYLIFEPEDTTSRTKNLQQTNTSGYKFQGSPEDLEKAKEFAKTIGLENREYSYDPEFQSLLKQIKARFDYRSDTNFAKLDRINHSSIEAFKSRVLKTKIFCLTLKEWLAVFKKLDEGKRLKDKEEKAFMALVSRLTEIQ